MKLSRTRIVLLSCLGIAGILAGAVALAETLQPDSVHSSCYFRVAHMGMSLVYGRFNEISSAIEWDAQNLGASKFNLKVKADSVDTGNAKRDAHLKSDTFLNVAEFPEIRFESAKVTAGKNANEYLVAGKLTLHGVTKDLTVPLTKMGEGKGASGNETIGFVTDVDLKRSDYGMDKMLSGVGDDIHLMISIEAARAKTGK